MDLKKERLYVEEAKTSPRAFGYLFDTYYSSILRYCIRRVGDIAVAEDITSETFIKSYQNIHKFTWNNVSISAWFYKIATNEIRMYFRSGKYNATSLDELYEREGFEPAANTDLERESIDAQEVLERKAEFIRAQQVLATLPVKYQEVVSLRFVEHKKLAEIALILGKKEATIKSLLSRALSRLRNELDATKTQPFMDAGIIASEGQLIIESERLHEE